MARVVVVRRIRHDHAEMRQAATACIVKKRRVVEEGAARITGDLQKTPFPLSFPYVCPEPVLVNRSFYVEMAQRRAFSAPRPSLYRES